MNVTGNPAVRAVTVVQGDPAPEELAALVVALHAARGESAPSPVTRRPRRSLRRTLTPGPGGWRESRWTMGGHL
ncbi:acyl-CoA carboxylase epsilon subunit [Nonomuraea gerenzanensis]|uniref:Acyl-CoA carboxylase subunit epsilon n=1 Tax=Nonomuraea gerenzanensis TaxID=93944 RepID=A0A1M4ECP8_9ACTN|nr:acyl-CoA carboxylase epsilon subunit [Nonomuraea gerenzanensis]UBU18584.1 acyl-CoA carboxylase subunit epsilon [Nonomuraea gerenzanensis]SBO96428.1 hypothetical protein BN4615_P5944 [Nonomuraea gerenzanensis]